MRTRRPGPICETTRPSTSTLAEETRCTTALMALIWSLMWWPAPVQRLGDRRAAADGKVDSEQEECKCIFV
uniref:Uncharacterized protein MANES_16G034600 n=1 Tax=Rhizophora mucronata TaxID=61149 RepID=A0A2P2J1C3_RHIMU